MKQIVCDELQYYVVIILCLICCVDSYGVDTDDNSLFQVSVCLIKWRSSLQQFDPVLVSVAVWPQPEIRKRLANSVSLSASAVARQLGKNHI